MADVESAKAYLLQSSSKSGLNLYDHLASVLTKLLDERPENAVDSIEELSRQIKADVFTETTTMRDEAAATDQVTLAKSQAKLFQKETEEGAEDEDDAEDDGETPGKIENMIEQMRYFHDAGIGLGAEETFRVFLALKQLSKDFSLKKLRFWGKIYGSQANYLVAECEFNEEDAPEDDNVIPDPAEELDADGEGEEVEQLPQSKYEWPKLLSKEKYPAGANKFKYFVCNEANGGAGAWTALKDVLPIQIQRAREIKKLFTGNLATPILSYPPFPSSKLQYKGEKVDSAATFQDWQQNPGTEAEYLRAQIAQISSECIVSPMGYFTFDEDEDEDDEADRVFQKDEEYEGLAREKLLIEGDDGPDGWAHHVACILPQGTVKWQDPRNKDPDAEEDEDEDEDGDGEDEIEKETGYSLLAPIMQDPPVDGQQAWTSKFTSERNKRYAGVVITSNRWPGAHALSYGRGKKFQNVYFGWGHKYSATPYNPPLPPPAEAEYTIDETVTEVTDPTREEEEAFEALNAVKDGEGEDDDEDDDDDA